MLRRQCVKLLGLALITPLGLIRAERKPNTETLSGGELNKKYGIKLVGYGPDGLGTGSWSKCQYVHWKYGGGA